MTDALIIILDLWAEREFQEIEVTAAGKIADNLSRLDREIEELEYQLREASKDKSELLNAAKNGQWWVFRGILDEETIELFCDIEPNLEDFCETISVNRRYRP